MASPPTTTRTLASQLLRLSALGLAGANGSVIERGKRLRFDFKVEPFVGAREYNCRIELLRGGLKPRSYVLKPNLQALADGRRPPHIYDHDLEQTNLCLFMPGDGEWNARYWLADTIVPWTVEWLRYYEMWLVEGVWHGGGEHPDIQPRRRYGMRGKRSQSKNI